MSKIAQGFLCLALFVVAFSVTGSATADYVISNFFSGTNRVRDDGSVIGDYYPPPGVVPHPLVDVGNAYAVTPDLSTVYQFTNDLGSSAYVYVYDLQSRKYLPDKSLGGGLLHQPAMPLIRPSDPFGRGDFFAISNIQPLCCNFAQVIRHINRATNSDVETISPPSEQRIRDFAFGPGNRLYMAADQGIFVYQESATGFDLVSPTPLLGGLTGKITIGPDGHIYLLNSAIGAIQRHGTDGSFIDNFIPAVSTGPEFTTSVQFGVDGNLHVLVNTNKINKYNGATGALISTAEFPVLSPSFAYAATGRVTYVPVPEPNTLLLAAIGIVMAVTRRRRNLSGR